jgi:C-terminal processing protease CtpA/Prc
MYRFPPGRSCLYLFTLLICIFYPGANGTAQAQQKASSNDIGRGRQMLKIIKSQIKENYYDLNFHGMDLEASFAKADEMIKKADSEGQIFGIIALLVMELNDSHTFFIPPFRIVPVEYGWRMQLIGDECFIVAVKSGSDAEKQGLKAGDRVLFIDGMKPTREDLWKIEYLYNILRPKRRVELEVQSPGQSPRQLTAESKVLKTERDFIKEYKTKEDKDKEDKTKNSWAGTYFEMDKELFIWKMPSFDISPNSLGDVMSKARKYRTLILDLRGNSGGYEDTMLKLIGYFMDKDVRIGELVRRKERKPMVAKSMGTSAFTGRLVVLVDSKSASAAELFARVMQLEKRATVIGDRSSGMVMRGRIYEKPMFESVNWTEQMPFAMSITDADIVMTDGKSLERSGVVPNELLLPTAEDLLAGRDPVLTRAAALLDVKLEPERAGKLFTFVW